MRNVLSPVKTSLRKKPQLVLRMHRVNDAEDIYMDGQLDREVLERVPLYEFANEGECDRIE
jgi:hypothetical protein